MKAHFEKEQGPECLENFPNMRASDLVEDSMDAVTFVLDLESELGIEIPLDQVGPKLASMTFLELADELSSMVCGKQ
jgi:acyl carrier protein